MDEEPSLPRRLAAILAADMAGYSRLMHEDEASTVREPGDFALRGGIVDLWPPGTDEPLRLDFFGSTLDAIRRFDAETQLSTDPISEIELLPAAETPLDADSISRFRTGYVATFGPAGGDDVLYESVSAGRKHQGMEHWLPLFHDHLDTLFDYAPDALDWYGIDLHGNAPFDFATYDRLKAYLDGFRILVQRRTGLSYPRINVCEASTRDEYNRPQFFRNIARWLHHHGGCRMLASYRDGGAGGPWAATDVDAINAFQIIVASYVHPPAGSRSRTFSTTPGR